MIRDRTSSSPASVLLRPASTAYVSSRRAQASLSSFPLSIHTRIHAARLSLIAIELLRSESTGDDQSFWYQPLAKPGSSIRLMEVDPELLLDGKL